MSISALLFDKDGTLFDFSATWSNWGDKVLTGLAGDDRALAGRIADVLGFDPVARSYGPHSPVIALTTHEVAEIVAPVLGVTDIDRLAARLNAMSAGTPQVPAVPLRPCLSSLKDRGLRLGLVTNDAEASARVHLEHADIIDLFDFVAGYDSGFGAKPEPGQIDAFRTREGLAPGQIAMIGDSPHDMAAARAAGTHAVGVLTGPNTRAILAPLADTVLDNIGGLGAWLDQQK